MIEQGGQFPILVAAAPAAMPGARAEYLTPVSSRWPDASRSGQVACAPLLGLGALLDALARADVPLPADAALIVFDRTCPAQMIDFAAELLRNASLPAVCIVPDPQPWREFQSGGIIFESPAADPSVIAAMLFALSQRQGAVRAMRREIDLTQRCELAIRAEMERMHEELQLAASVQREFISLPAPRAELLEHAIFSRAVNFVSGDVCCVRDLQDGRICFFLADAAGHGVPAALLTMVLVHSLQTMARETGEVVLLEPRDVLARLNTCICTHCRNFGWFATAVYGIVCPATGQITLAGAGHPPPMVLGGASGRLELETTGPVLGVIDDPEFSQVSCTMAPDQVLLVYSDGLECAFPDATAGEQKQQVRERPHLRYLEELDRDVAAMFTRPEPEHGPTMAEEVIMRLGHMIDEQAGSLHQADDITAMIIRCQRRSQQLRRAA